MTKPVDKSAIPKTVLKEPTAPADPGPFRYSRGRKKKVERSDDDSCEDCGKRIGDHSPLDWLAHIEVLEKQSAAIMQELKQMLTSCFTRSETEPAPEPVAPEETK